MTARLVCEFVVEGDPVPQGSMTGRRRPGGEGAIVYASNAKKLKVWRDQVTAAARESYSGPRVEGAVSCAVEFRLVKPKTVRREYPAVYPDVDKLARAICDAVTAAGTWRDDGQVVILHVTKVYAERAGVRVRIGELREGSKA